MREFDPQDNDDQKVGLVKDLEKVALDPSQPEKVVQVGSAFLRDLKADFISFLRDHKDLFS